MCTDSLEGWKDSLMQALSKRPGIGVTIQDALLPVTALIVCKVTGNRCVHEALVTLVRHVDHDEVYHWIEALQFPSEWDVERQATKLLRHFEFLEKSNAGWLLEFV
jgi:hypothetical protein